jgi:hypothetical protein
MAFVQKKRFFNVFLDFSLSFLISNFFSIKLDVDKTSEDQEIEAFCWLQYIFGDFLMIKALCFSKYQCIICENKTEKAYYN